MRRLHDLSVFNATLGFALLVLASTGYSFDHSYSGYAVVLKTYVKSGGVEYAALQKNRKPLDQFIQEIGTVNSTEYAKWSREQQLAFWINAYNAWILRIVIDHYPISRNRLTGLVFPENSVQQIDGVWGNIQMQSPAGKVSLNDMEHKILRGQFMQPRIHFAIVCASLGCPPLKKEPYTPDQIYDQLEDSARKFATDRSRVKMDQAARRIDISQIFKWFSEDFAGFSDDQWRHEYSVEKAGPLAFLSRYFPADDALFLKAGPVDVTYLPYDWSLNEWK